MTVPDGWKLLATVLASWAVPFAMAGEDGFKRAPLRPFIGLPATIDGERGLPRLLSQTGVFAEVAALTPVPGIAGFSVNQPLWSDFAVKLRWIAVPNDGEPYAAGEQVAVARDGPWKFPAGTVLIKHFALPLDLRKPDGAVRKLETRLLTVARDGMVAGVTYRWRDDGSDAELQAQAEDAVYRDYEVIGLDGASTKVTWTFPSREQCIACHTPESGGILGFTTRQLNRSVGGGANQLVRLAEGGWLDRPWSAAEVATLPKLHAFNDPGIDAVSRIRSYLDANCAHCHHPETRVGGGGFLLDLRAQTPLAKQNLIDSDAANSLGVDDGKIIAPGSLERSVLLDRISRRDVFGMPPVGSNHLDESFVAEVKAWIKSLPAAAKP
ncbi:hypothetical protein LBMAG53_34720 [Planctomycetota bacterium]|nr:hypothetical protein LBMAG53_34720 [Planctomycetota bacterium]